MNGKLEECWSWPCQLSCLIICCRGHCTHTFPALNHSKCCCARPDSEWVRHPHIIMLHTAATAEEAQGLDAALALPESRGLLDHLGFPKIRVATETQSHRQCGEGWMTQLVSSSVSWLLLAFSNCLPTLTVEYTPAKPFYNNWRKLVLHFLN